MPTLSGCVIALSRTGPPAETREAMSFVPVTFTAATFVRITSNKRQVSTWNCLIAHCAIGAVSKSPGVDLHCTLHCPDPVQL